VRVARQLEHKPAPRRDEEAVPREQLDGPAKVGHGPIGPAEPIPDQAALDHDVRVKRLAGGGPFQQGFDTPGPAELGLGLGQPQHDPRVLRLGPHRLVELGLRPDEPPL
jgi:hypothetical protein